MESEEYKICASSVRSASVSVKYLLDIVLGLTVDGDECGIHCGEQRLAAGVASVLSGGKQCRQSPSSTAAVQWGSNLIIHLGTSGGGVEGGQT